MNRIRVTVVGLFLMCLFIPSCHDLGEGNSASGEWAIYRLADPAITSYQLRNAPTPNMTLAAVPLISVRDLRAYHWKSHVLEFTPEVGKRIDSISRASGTSRGIPFVVTLDRQPVYVGTFWWSYSSLAPWCPYWDITVPNSDSISVGAIELLEFYQGSDPRSDRRLYASLKTAGVLVED
jgi:hypothetical protein